MLVLKCLDSSATYRDDGFSARLEEAEYGTTAGDGLTVEELLHKEEDELCRAHI